VGRLGEQPPAKYYRLTAAGRRRLGEETASWNHLAQAIARALAATPQEVAG
jgi:DNA-binding PadR family transcriptional regulator